MKTPVLFFVIAALTSGAAHARDADLDAAEKIYSGVCKNCHGPAGRGMASFPRLAGRDADYIATRLKQYRAGESVGPNSPLMIPQAAELSDEDIDGLAAYISRAFR